MKFRYLELLIPQLIYPLDPYIISIILTIFTFFQNELARGLLPCYPATLLPWYQSDERKHI